MSADADRIGSATADLMANITDELHDISPRPVGYGGYADIHTGVWRSTFGTMKVAIKIFRAAPRSRSASNELPRVLRREIAVWKRLLHPNIHFLCGFYEGFGSVPALVSPWYENGHINDYVRLHTTDPDVGQMKLKLFADVVTGLRFLHEHHIVHGDIKGANVLISSTGVARLSDFGLSRLLLEHSQSTTSTGGKGTVRWMAPELLLVEGARHSYASDIWACGCLFIEVWSNVLPYHDKINDHQVLIALSRHEPPLRPDAMPDIVWSLVHACCVSETAGRTSPSSLLDMIHVSLAMERVGKMVSSSDLLNVEETDLLAEIATSLRAVDGGGAIDLEKLADNALATAVVRYYAVWGISCSRLFETSVFEWCLATIGIDNLILPAREDRIDTVTAAELPPFARLVAQVRPGLAKHFMTEFPDCAPGRPFVNKVKECATREQSLGKDAGSSRYSMQGAAIMFQKVDTAIESGQRAVIARVVSESVRAMKIMQEQCTKVLDAEHKKQLDKPDEQPGSLFDYLIELANNQIKCAEYAEALEARLEPLMSAMYNVFISEKLNEATEGYIDVATKCTQTLSYLIFNDLKPSINLLFAAAWYDGIMSHVVTGIRNYMLHYQAFLHPHVRSLLVDDLINNFVLSYLNALARTSKLRMPQATNRIRDDIDEAFAFFMTLKVPAELEAYFEVIELVLGMLTASKTRVVVEFWRFANRYGPNLPFVEAIICARNDLARFGTNDIIESIRQRVQDEILKNPVKPTIMKKVTVPSDFLRLLPTKN